MGYVGDMGTPINKMTTLGPIIGRVDANGIERYYGIPTAATTGGNNRWRAPQPTSWTVPIDTVRERICMCHGGAVGEEDCMSMDVMTASDLVDAATFVYTHGGGFMGEDPPYEHQTMAYYQQAGPASYLPNGGRSVTGLMHYRLGPLGFMAHPGLSMETGYGASGNWGVMDVLHNMKWLNDNVAQFGGAASLITLVGESAGAAMVLITTSSPHAEGLYHAVIAESPYVSFKDATYSLHARYAMTQAAVLVGGCGSLGIPSGAVATAQINCMRGLPLAAFNGIAGATAEWDAIYGGLAAPVGVQLRQLLAGHRWLHLAALCPRQLPRRRQRGQALHRRPQRG
jgi:para-nitrobenzyl esterase